MNQVIERHYGRKIVQGHSLKIITEVIIDEVIDSWMDGLIPAGCESTDAA